MPGVHLYSAFLDQHRIKSSLATETVSRILKHVSTSFSHPETGVFAPKSLQNCSSSLRLDKKHLWTLLFWICYISLVCICCSLLKAHLSPSVSLEKEEDTAVVVLGMRPRTFSDSRSVFLLAGPLLTRVYAARDRRDIFSGACRRLLISSYEMRYFPENEVRQIETNQHSRAGNLKTEFMQTAYINPE